MRHPHGFRAAAGNVGAGELQPGDPLEGGYFAGYISHTANGIATHALIVAPAATGYNGRSQVAWKSENTSTSGTSNVYDGAPNTANMADGNHPAADYCAGLSIGGYSDWYLPARYELEIAYYNLKPTTQNNYTSSGTNPYSVPVRGSNYTAGDPAQTSASDFQKSGAFKEEFNTSYHWSSTEVSSSQVNVLYFNDGVSANYYKTWSANVRAFRKIAL